MTSVLLTGATAKAAIKPTTVTMMQGRLPSSWASITARLPLLNWQFLLPIPEEKCAFVRTDTSVKPPQLANFFFYFFQFPQSNIESKDRNATLPLNVCLQVAYISTFEKTF